MLGSGSASSSSKIVASSDALPQVTSVSADVPHTTLSPSLVPQTMLSPSSAVPQTTLSPSLVPQTTLSQSAPPQSVPQTTLSPSSVPQTMLSPSVSVPHTMLSIVGAPDDVVPIVAECFGGPPDDIGGPRIGGRLDGAALQTVAAPDDLPAPDRLNRHGLAGAVAGEVAGQPDGAERVQEPCALPQRTVAGVRLCGVLQNGLHEVRREVRIRLEHQGDGAADDRRGHARPAQREIRLEAE